MEPILPPATIGMLGGGQLGRYAVMAARTMGYRTMVLDPDPYAPAGALADEHLVAEYDDHEALRELGDSCEVVTTEFENPPAASLEALERRTIVSPSPQAVAIVQDRIREKAFLTDIGMPVGEYAVMDDVEATPAVSYPAIVKTGAPRVRRQGSAQVCRPLGAASCVPPARSGTLRGRVGVAAPDRDQRGGRQDGAAADSWRIPSPENVHANGILDLTVVPSSVRPQIADRAGGLAMAIADALGYVGVLAVEFFVVDGQVLVNEIAPRPHNSGHWTLDVSQTSQFEQQIRAVCGLGLGDTSMTAPGAAMANLLGDLSGRSEPDWARVFDHATVALHLYGKTIARPGRKMGHLTAWAASPEAAEMTVTGARSALGQSPAAS